MNNKRTEARRTAGLIYTLDKDRGWRIETGYMFHSMWNAPESEPGRETHKSHVAHYADRRCANEKKMSIVHR